MNLLEIIENRYQEIYEVGTCQKDIEDLLKSLDNRKEVYTLDIDIFCKWLWENN
jgi:hypothetical protein